MKRKLFLLSLIGIVLSFCTSAKAQGDTVKGRYLISTLNDSTQFIYVLSQLHIRRGSNSFFLGFENFPSNGNYETEWLKSTSFTGIGSVDSIVFSRTFNYLDPAFYHPTQSFDSTNLDSLTSQNSSLITHKVIPNSSYFNSLSSIRYILELLRVSDDSVLDRPDTVNCYVNSNGMLRFTTTNNTPDLRMVLRTIPMNMEVYLKVKIEKTLPLGTVCTYENGEFAEEERGLYGLKLYSIYQDNVAIGSNKQSTFKENSQPLDPFSTTVSLQENGSIEVSIVSNTADHFTFDLYDELGKLVYSTKSDIHEGKTNFYLQPAGLVSGVYYLTVSAGSQKQSHKLTFTR